MEGQRSGHGRRCYSAHKAFQNNRSTYLDRLYSHGRRLNIFLTLFPLGDHPLPLRYDWWTQPFGGQGRACDRAYPSSSHCDWFISQGVIWAGPIRSKAGTSARAIKEGIFEIESCGRKAICNHMGRSYLKRKPRERVLFETEHCGCVGLDNSQLWGLYHALGDA